jgi:hypothetical protein
VDGRADGAREHDLGDKEYGELTTGVRPDIVIAVGMLLLAGLGCVIFAPFAQMTDGTGGRALVLSLMWFVPAGLLALHARSRKPESFAVHERGFVYQRVGGPLIAAQWTDVTEVVEQLSHRMPGEYPLTRMRVTLADGTSFIVSNRFTNFEGIVTTFRTRTSASTKTRVWPLW